MSDFLKNKKVIIGIASVLILSVLIIGGLFLFRKEEKSPNEEKLLKEQNYTMFIKINPLVKLTFKETYYECTSVNDYGEEQKSICSDISNEVVDYTLINNDAKEIYNDINFKGKNVLDSLILLCDTARNNNIAFENLEIVSDYDFDKVELIKELKEKSSYEYNVFVDFKEKIIENEIIEKLEGEPIKTYTVSFDSNGGSKLDSVVVRENDKLTQPTAPTKQGYKFIEWQLNGKKFDFESSITSNITLKASWKKVSSQNNNNNNSNNNQSGNTNTGTQTEDKTISKEVQLQNHKVKGLNAYSDSKTVVESQFWGYLSLIKVTVTGKKGLVDNITSSNLQLGVDLTLYREKGQYNTKLVVANPVSGVTYKINDDSVTVNISVKKKVSSTFNKINLNDNILENEDYETNYGRNILAINFKEVFGSNSIIYDSGCTPGYMSYTEYQTLSSNLTIDQTSLNNFLSKFNNLKNSKKPNINNLTYEYNATTHNFTYSFNYLSIADEDILNLPNEFNNSKTVVTNLLKDTLVNTVDTDPCRGDTGGGNPVPSKVLDETLCNKYNLNCSRW